MRRQWWPGGSNPKTSWVDFFPLAGCCIRPLPAIDLETGRKKTAVLTGADTACLWRFETPLRISMPNQKIGVKRLAR